LNRKPDRIWNINFLLLWQGQFVSAVGDVAYEIALGFWVLAVTGSTALMGTLMAAATIPRVILSPFAGVVVDRVNRKWLLVLMDAARGTAVVFVAVAAYQDALKIWMVFAAGIIIGLGAAFFNPATLSIVPDLVKKDDLVKANSFFSMIRAGSGILGNSLGGILYGLLGAPLMFLVNGLSYIFSSISEIFIAVPTIHKNKDRSKFFDDMKDGMTFVWQLRSLRFMMIIAGVFNFFAWIALVLILPLFQRTAGLGATRYGFTMALFTIGMLLGMGLTAAVKIDASKRFFVFTLCTLSFILCLTLFPLWNIFPLMLILVFFGGFTNSIVNVLLISIIQLAVPADKRGKVMGFLETLTQGLTPIGMAAGGFLGEYLPIKFVISGSFIVIGIIILPALFFNRTKDFFSTEGES
jgi:MFS transporter, DHA3 family, macrolide efflux protein